jgi:hypothetical protein
MVASPEEVVAMTRLIRTSSARLPLTAALVALCLASAAALRASMPVAGAGPAMITKAELLDVTLFADKPTIVKLAQSAVGLIRVTPKMLRTKVGTKEQIVDFTQPGAYVMLHEAAGPKKMAAAYFLMPSATNLTMPFMEVELDGPDAARSSRFACYLPTAFDPVKGFGFNIRVETGGGFTNCSSTDKGFKVAFEYNVKPGGQ